MKTMFTYNMSGMGQRERMAIRRKLFGYTDKSNRGRYNYKREGLLSKVEHEMPARCCIVVGERDSRKLEAFFRENSVRYQKFTLMQYRKA